MSEPIVIANQAHLPGLRLPGEYDVEFDRESGYVTVLEGPEAGKTFLPTGAVLEAIERALDPSQEDVVNESVETYVETPEGETA